MGDIKNDEGEMGIDIEQADLIKSVLGINNLKASSIMIPANDIFMLSYDDVLDKNKLKFLLEKGFSRIPIYADKDKNNIIGRLI